MNASPFSGAAAPVHVLEPSLDEILSDPLVGLILRRDGLTAGVVRAHLERERRRLHAGMSMLRQAA